MVTPHKVVTGHYLSLSTRKLGGIISDIGIGMFE